MSKVTHGRRRGARLLSRALLVLGGAVAGTAAAWVISSASAQADTLTPVVPVAPVTQVLTTTVATPAAVAHTASESKPVSPPVSIPAMLPAVLPAALPTSLPTSLPATLPVSAVRSASGLAAVTDRLRAAVAEFDGLGAGNPPAGQFRAPVASRGGAPVPAPAVAGALSTARNAPAGQAAGAAGTVHTFAAHTGSPGVPAARAGGSGGHVPAGSGSGQQYTPGLVPSGAGTAGSSGSAGPGGSVLGAQFTQPGVPGLFSLGGTAQGIPLGAVPTGKQPGVTPD